MDFKKFEYFINKLFEHSETINSLYDLKIDLIEFSSSYNELIFSLAHEIFTVEGIDWIEWYVYESKPLSREPLTARDKDGNRICYDIPSLYSYLLESKYIKCLK